MVFGEADHALDGGEGLFGEVARGEAPLGPGQGAGPDTAPRRITADFEGGSISSDGGLVLLRAAERRLGLAEALAGCIREWRDPQRVVHTLPAMLRFRMFAIACGYEDADDCDALRTDPLLKLAVGRAPESGRDLCSQPTMSRLP